MSEDYQNLHAFLCFTHSFAANVLGKDPHTVSPGFHTGGMGGFTPGMNLTWGDILHQIEFFGKIFFCF
jgi:hypothetical protein